MPPIPYPRSWFKTFGIPKANTPCQAKAPSGPLTLDEQMIFGSSREGVINRSLNLSTATLPTTTYSNLIGDKQYQHSNHLGNVLATVSDVPLADNGGSGSTLVAWNAYYLSAHTYSSFGAKLVDGVTNWGTEYRYGFNGMEGDDEVKGDGNGYDFGARMYDPRLGRWLSVDALTGKYPYDSPYIFCHDSPIFVFDADGNEGIVVSGQPGGHTNKDHFLSNGLYKAKAAQKKLRKSGEKVTWIIYDDGTSENGHDPEMLEKYKEKAKKAGINVIVVNDAGKIVEYVNEKTGGNSRASDPITSFYYIGHSTPGEFNPGYNTNTGADDDFEPHDFKSDAFASGCHVNLVGGCRTAIGWWPFYDSVADDFADILDSKSKIYASDVRVYYSGGIVSDEELVKYNNGNIVTLSGKLPAKSSSKNSGGFIWGREPSESSSSEDNETTPSRPSF